MKMNKLFLAAIFSLALLVSCDSDDDANEAPLGSYDNGVLVLNEGDVGTVTYLSNDLATIQQDIFNVVNGDEINQGLYNQSLFFDGDRAFIISNGSNKITVVNRYTFEYISTISTGFSVPRYAVVYNGKAYVTNSNDFGSSTDDFIAVINLATLAVEAPIAVNYQAEKVVEYDGKLYVSGGFYNEGDRITVIDAVTKTIVDTITTGETPNSLEVVGSTLYVLCGNFDDTSRLLKIDLADNSIEDEIVFPESMGNSQNLDIESGKIYFTSGAKVYRVALNAIAVTDTPLVDTESPSPYIGYGFAVHGDRIYISEAAADFVSNGKIFIYNTNGSPIDDFAAGLGPNGFYFND